MQLTIQINDESKLDFLLQFFREIAFVEVLPMPEKVISNGSANGKIPGKKKLTAKQQEMLEGLKEAFHEVELHTQGKIKLQPAREFIAEL